MNSKGMSRDEIVAEIDSTKNLIEEVETKIDQIHDSLSESEMNDKFDEMLDETCPVVTLGSLEYSPSYVLKNVDETAYRCGVNDYIDSLEPSDFPDYEPLTEQLEELEANLEELESDLEDEDEEEEEEQAEPEA